MNPNKIAFIGAGNMASALIGGLIANGFVPENICASDLDSSKLDELHQRYGIKTTPDNRQAVNDANCVVLAVKPQVLKTVSIQIAEPIQQSKPLVVSIAAGIKGSDIERWLGSNIAMVRAMPNTPSLLQCGATGLHANERVSPAQKQLAESLLSAVGITLWVDKESLIDTVTAVSGSGPAYYFLMMEAMTAAGESLGLSPAAAKQLTLQTALGAARMANEGELDPATLRKNVTSPGGTTEQALNTFEENGLRDIFKQAMTAAHRRSIELSEILGKD